MEEESNRLSGKLKENVRLRDESNKKLANLLDSVHGVKHSFIDVDAISVMIHRDQVHETFNDLPIDELEMWTLQTMESTAVQPG
jgi:hypothetical protein